MMCVEATPLRAPPHGSGRGLLSGVRARQQKPGAGPDPERRHHELGEDVADMVGADVEPGQHRPDRDHDQDDEQPHRQARVGPEQRRGSPRRCRPPCRCGPTGSCGRARAPTAGCARAGAAAGRATCRPGRTGRARRRGRRRTPAATRCASTPRRPRPSKARTTAPVSVWPRNVPMSARLGQPTRALVDEPPVDRALVRHRALQRVGDQPADTHQQRGQDGQRGDQLDHGPPERAPRGRGETTGRGHAADCSVRRAGGLHRKG